MSEPHCDWKGKCKRRAYKEVFPLTRKPPEAKRFCPMDEWIFHDWSYLCFRHFYYARLRNWVRQHILRQRVALSWSEDNACDLWQKERDDEQEAEAELEAMKARTEQDMEDMQREIEEDRLSREMEQ